MTHATGAAFGSNLDRAADLPRGAVPAVESLFESVADSGFDVLVYFPMILADYGHHVRQLVRTPATNTVLTHAYSDMLALLKHADAGDGRSAAHSARALFEHLVNFLDVSTSDDLNTRYTCQEVMTDQLIASCAVGLDLLKGEERRKEQQRLDTLSRKSRQGVREALTKYGGGFQRQWNPSTLRDRATAHQLGERYEHYKLLSAVIHGSSGGLVGATQATPEGRVHRVGGNLQLAAVALLEGLRSFRGVLDAMRQSPPEMVNPWAAVQLIEVIDAAIEAWPTYRKKALQVDRRLWPSTPPPPATVSVMAKYPKGRVRWFLHDLENGLFVPAQAPTGPVPYIDKLPEWTDQDWDNAGGRPMTVALTWVVLAPIPGADPFPASALMQPSDSATRTWREVEL